jgi:hypothetical protein
MIDMQYVKLTEVNGRWKADIIESFLVAEGIEVQLIQDAVTHYLYKSPFDLVQIFVPNKKVLEARELLKPFDEFKPEEEYLRL